MSLRLLLAILALFVLPGCAALKNYEQWQQTRADNRKFGALRTDALAADAAFRGEKKWKSKTFRNKDVLALAKPDDISIEIALSEQRGLLLVHGAIGMDFPVATGKKSHPTPAGSYKIRAKQKDYFSNLYGKIYDVAGVVVVADADTRTDVIPEGGSFGGASMPYWMRLTDTGVGMHVGYVPGHPASHGCIRLKRDTASELFALTKIGTPVVIAEKAAALEGAVKKP